jgi:hypothetical protein
MSMPTGANPYGKISGYKQASMSRLSPEQQQLFSTLMGGSLPGIEGGLGQLTQMAQGGTPEFWEQMEAPAMRQFAGLQGNLASRFSGMGMGSRRSSGFQNSMTGATTDFAERLQSQRLGLQQKAISDLLGVGRDLLGRDTRENFLVQSPWMSMLGSFGQGLGSIGGALAGRNWGG